MAEENQLDQVAAEEAAQAAALAHRGLSHSF